jgi:hypothetical protein
MLMERHESTGTDYLAWVTITVPGWLVEGNIDAMGLALREMPKRTSIVEIGSFCGLSACVISHLKDKYQVVGPFFTCDPWIFESLLWLPDDQPFFGSKFMKHVDYKNFIRTSFQRNVSAFCQPDLPHSFDLSSDRFFAKWSMNETLPDIFGYPATLGGPIGFCYIDGDHRSSFVLRDFLNADTWLPRGGFILFDDSGKDTEYPDVVKVAEQVATRGGYKVVSREPNYLLQKY